MVITQGREQRLVSRSTGAVTVDQFELVEVPVPEPADGQVLVRNEWMLLSVVWRELAALEPHPDLPMPTFALGEAPWSPTVGTVVRSAAAGVAVGDLVLHNLGFREYALCAAADVTRLDRDAVPTSAHHLNRAQGRTAWRGMVTLADVGAGDTVFVAGATSGVGALAGRIAACRGAARVIGSTGSTDKIPYLVDRLGFDAAFDYHDGPVADRLAELAPDGIDVVFDNVGGEQFEAAVATAAPQARIVLCGLMSGTMPTLDVESMILKDLTVRGFTTCDGDDLIEFDEQHDAWGREGRVLLEPTMVEGGIEAVPQAVVDLLDRRFAGVVAVRLYD
jgi:NADPH-dependent curcumin reductase CurA